ncbi:MAG TPA: hypothetical protein PLW24_19110 [Burkholderiaceae bacterium]|nr:hypothetical protein [Burkholderiaceae bacterium]HNB45618.1 hypothetical protein [Burkholderiaceae bacterium]HNG81590.1 hypothetical protein [Burkholderiaceae bacterium]
MKRAPRRLSRCSRLLSVWALTACGACWAAGGYDQGTPAGRGNLDLDFTLNPGDRVKNGQSYVVWGYGLTDRLDFHGYLSHEAGGTDQIYYGLMLNVFGGPWLDLSTAVGLRHRDGDTHLLFPQLLYTIKLPRDFDVIGSVTRVRNNSTGRSGLPTLDVALRIPLPDDWRPSLAKSWKLDLGVFRNSAGSWNPTYSVDFKF